MTRWRASAVAILLASFPGVASAQPNCEAIPHGPERTDCYLALRDHRLRPMDCRGKFRPRPSAETHCPQRQCRHGSLCFRHRHRGPDHHAQPAPPELCRQHPALAVCDRAPSPQACLDHADVVAVAGRDRRRGTRRDYRLSAARQGQALQGRRNVSFRSSSSSAPPSS
jgi:hypothetical protein